MPKREKTPRISKTTSIRADFAYPNAIAPQGIAGSLDEYRKALGGTDMSDQELKNIVGGLSGLIDIGLDDYFNLDAEVL